MAFPAPSGPRRVRFDAFELDEESGELFREGVRVPIQEQPLIVLRALLEKPGGVVTRDELYARLWPEDIHLDFDHGLNAAVRRLRDTLGDGAEGPRIIETLPRRGYRLTSRAIRHGPVEMPPPQASPDLATDRSSAGRLEQRLQPADRPRPGLSRRWRLVLALAGVAACLTLAVFVTRPATSPAAVGVVRSVVTLPPDSPVALERSAAQGIGRPSIALSPSGNHLVYVGEQDGTTMLFVRAMDDLTVKPIPGTEGGFNPFFSPDGRWLGFFASDKLKKTTLGGALEPVTVCEARHPYGASWSRDDTIVFVDNEGWRVARVSASGGDPQTVVRAQYLWPDVLPSGTEVLLRDDANRIILLSLHTGEHQVLVEGATSARYVPTGHIVYSTDGSLFAVPFDVKTTKVTGGGVPIVQGVRMEDHKGAAQYSFAGNGSLVYVSGQRGVGRLVWADRQGHVEPVPLPPALYGPFRLSPDGRKLAIRITDAGHDVWVYDFDRDQLTRATVDGTSGMPLWTPDGRSLTFSATPAGAAGIFVRPADGSTDAERLVGSDRQRYASSWSPDGNVLAFFEDAGNGPDIWFLTRRAQNATTPFVRNRFNTWGPMFSPDGDWIAYTSDESGHFEVYVRRYPGGRPRFQVSVDGGEEPVWSRDGGELFYRDGSRWLAVSVDTSDGFSFGSPRLLFEGRFLNVPGLSYDVSPDGQRFLVIQPAEEEPVPTQVTLVVNWFEELRRLAPPR